MNMEAVKERVSAPKKEHKKIKNALFLIIKFAVCFLSSRTTLFFNLTPFGVSSFLALGGGVVPYIGAMLGYFSIGSFEGLFYTTVVYITKIFVRNEKADVGLLLVGGCIVYSAIVLQGGFLPYSVILRLLSVLVTTFSYYPIKKGFKAQTKPFSLKFTKREGYSSILLLLITVLGIRSENITYFINISNIIKIYIIAVTSYISGIGGGSAIGAVLGILSGKNGTNCALIMANYSLMGFFSGIFSKFTKLTSALGILCAYVFSVIYMEQTVLMGFWDTVIASALFLLTPGKYLKQYFLRYSRREPVKDMMSAVNSITASRLSKLAESFTGLSNEIAVSKNSKSLVNINYNSLFDFLGDKVCKKCTLKNICWQKDYDNTAQCLTKAIHKMENGSPLMLDDFDGVFKERCTKINEVIINCRNFYDILKINALWKNKMHENTRAFKQQFIEMSKIICDLKQNIETNKYFEAELSGELYGVLTEEGYSVKEVFVIKDATDTFYVKLILFSCKGSENCIGKIKTLIEDVLGVCVVKSEGGCSENYCTLFFKEGASATIEKRIYRIPKSPDAPMGDSCKITAITPGKYLIALCDGMGSGENAQKISDSVINLTEQMLKAGFSEEAVYKMINSFILANLSVSGFSTLDFIVIDTKTMTGKIIKNGACPTYIKRINGDIITIQNKSLPVGIREQKPVVKTVNIMKSDMIIMVSDGTLDSNSDKDWIFKLLKKTYDQNLTETIDLIYEIAQKDYQNQQDDITILGIKVN